MNIFTFVNVSLTTSKITQLEAIS